MGYPIEDVIPVSVNQFDPIAAVNASDEPEVVKEMRIGNLVEKSDYPFLPQKMLFNYSFDLNDAKSNGVFAPQQILGPRRRINVEDIKPGMGNVSYLKTLTDGLIVTGHFTGLVTKVIEVDGRPQIYADEQMVRDSDNKQWFVQHIWNYSAVQKVDMPGRDEEFYLADNSDTDGDYLLSINLDPFKPNMTLFPYQKVGSSFLIAAYEGRSAVYYLTPRLDVPRLSDAPIPAMPGAATPQPGPDAPDSGDQPGPVDTIPPMPGEVESWDKPKTKDWWIS